MAQQAPSLATGAFGAPLRTNGALAGAKRQAQSESPPGTPFVPRKRRTPAAGAHSNAAYGNAVTSGAACAGPPSTAPSVAAVPAPVSSSVDAGEGTQSFLRNQPPTPARARSGDMPDAWQARRKASSGVAGTSSDAAHVPDLTVWALFVRFQPWRCAALRLGGVRLLDERDFMSGCTTAVKLCFVGVGRANQG